MLVNTLYNLQDTGFTRILYSVTFCRAAGGTAFPIIHLQCSSRTLSRFFYYYILGAHRHKVDCWEKRTEGLFRTFEDFEFRAAFTDPKNTGQRQH
jgi:hypothetical protein